MSKPTSNNVTNCPDSVQPFVPKVTSSKTSVSEGRFRDFNWLITDGTKEVDVRNKACKVAYEIPKVIISTDATDTSLSSKSTQSSNGGESSANQKPGMIVPESVAAASGGHVVTNTAECVKETKGSRTESGSESSKSTSGMPATLTSQFVKETVAALVRSLSKNAQLSAFTLTPHKLGQSSSSSKAKTEVHTENKKAQSDNSSSDCQVVNKRVKAMPEKPTDRQNKSKSRNKESLIQKSSNIDSCRTPKTTLSKVPQSCPVKLQPKSVVKAKSNASNNDVLIQSYILESVAFNVDNNKDKPEGTTSSKKGERLEHDPEISKGIKTMEVSQTSVSFIVTNPLSKSTDEPEPVASSTMNCSESSHAIASLSGLNGPESEPIASSPTNDLSTQSDLGQGKSKAVEVSDKEQSSVCASSDTGTVAPVAKSLSQCVPTESDGSSSLPTVQEHNSSVPVVQEGNASVSVQGGTSTVPVDQEYTSFVPDMPERTSPGKVTIAKLEASNSCEVNTSKSASKSIETSQDPAQSLGEAKEHSPVDPDEKSSMVFENQETIQATVASNWSSRQSHEKPKVLISNKASSAAGTAAAGSENLTPTLVHLLKHLHFLCQNNNNNVSDGE